MKIHELWKQSNILIAIVPLAIDDYGFIYINDIGVMNITINEKHRSMHQHQITTAQLKEIAEIKLRDLNAYTVEEAMRIVAGTAKNMGIEIKD